MAKRRFRKPFRINPPIPKEDQAHFTKFRDSEAGQEWQEGINDLYTVEDADGLTISSHRTRPAAEVALGQANANL